MSVGNINYFLSFLKQRLIDAFIKIGMHVWRTQREHYFIDTFVIHVLVLEHTLIMLNCQNLEMHCLD